MNLLAAGEAAIFGVLAGFPVAGAIGRWVYAIVTTVRSRHVAGSEPCRRTNASTTRVDATRSSRTPSSEHRPRPLLVHALRRSRFGSHPVDLLSITVLPVAASAVVVWLLLRALRPATSAEAIVTLHVAGIWLLGPVCMMAGASFSGGGFTRPGFFSPESAVLLFPPITFIMAIYDGTLAALGLVTLAPVLYFLLRALESSASQRNA